MVKVQFRVVRKPGKSGRVYVYEQVSINIPKDLHELLRSLKDRKLEIRGQKEGNTIHILLIDKGSG